MPQLTPLMELQPTFPQRILFRLWVHRQDTVMSKLIQKTTATKTNTTSVSGITAANIGTVADDADATLFAPGICH